MTRMDDQRRVPNLGAVVVCGGQSRRMGRPKAWLPFGNETLLQRVVRTVGLVAAPTIVVAAPEQELPALPVDVVVTRDPTPYRGPLQGIATGLLHLNGRAEAAFVSSTDAPFLSPALIRRLAALWSASHDIVVPHAGGHYHPLCAVYACSVLPEAMALLDADKLRPFFLFERVRTLVADAALLLAEPAVAAADPKLRSFDNVNTPEEYEAALKNAKEA